MSEALGCLAQFQYQRKKEKEGLGGGGVAQRITLMLLDIWDASIRTRVRIHSTQVRVVAHLPSQGLGDKNGGSLPCSKLLI